MRIATEHHLANDRLREKTIKRGGRVKIITFEQLAAEGRFGKASSHELTAEKLFERQWALTLLDRVLQHLEAESAAFTSEKAALFGWLKPTLQGDALAPSYREIGAAMGMTEGAVRVAAHRLRIRYRELLRREIALSVDDPDGVDAEIAVLIKALSAS